MQPATSAEEANGDRHSPTESRCIQGLRRGDCVSKQTTRTKSLTKGLLAGLIGGIVATKAKAKAEKLYPPKTKTHGETEPPLLLEGKIRKTAGHRLTVPPKATSVGAIHLAVGRT